MPSDLLGFVGTLNLVVLLEISNFYKTKQQKIYKDVINLGSYKFIDFTPCIFNLATVLCSFKIPSLYVRVFVGSSYLVLWFPHFTSDIYSKS